MLGIVVYVVIGGMVGGFGFVDDQGFCFGQFEFGIGKVGLSFFVQIGYFVVGLVGGYMQ